VLVLNWLEYWTNYSIQNFEYSHITNFLIWCSLSRRFMFI